MKTKIELLCQWLRQTKGITKIDLFELMEYLPEFEAWEQEYKKEWIGSRVKCGLCNHEWISVFCIDTPKLECPNCKYLTHYKILNH